MCSIRTRLFLKVLPFAFKYSSWYRWRSIFLASLYLLRSLLRTRILMIHMVFWEVLASLVPFLLPNQCACPSYAPRRSCARETWSGQQHWLWKEEGYQGCQNLPEDHVDHENACA